MGKGGSQTIGYNYFMSLFMGLGREMSEIVQINVGGKPAWTGSVINGRDDIGTIDSPGLFGGEQKEGGIRGPFRVLWGGRNQVLPGPAGTPVGSLPDIRASLTAGGAAAVPAMRGVTSIWYDGLVCSMNPYPKEWKIRARRSVHGWHGGVAWYPEKAAIYLSGPEIVSEKRAERLGIKDIFEAKGGSRKKQVVINVTGNIVAHNGAHIIYECVTNPEWGRGIPADLLDENSFVYAANQICAELFGLCFFWTRQEDVDVFIQTVLDHIGGVLYTDRSTGLLTLRLIRHDYVIADLPTFSPGNGLLDILLDDSGSADIAYNEVVVKYHDPVSDTDGEARAQNVGSRLAQGSSNSVTKEFPGLPTKELAGRVAARELIVQTGLKKYKVRLDRSGWRIAPGMPFRIVCPQRGIGSIVLRAGEIADSSAQQGGDIQITALEDVFSMPATSMVVPEESVWTPPVSDAVPPDESMAFELSYYDLTKRLSQFDIPNVDDSDSYVGLMAAQPLSTQVLYDLMHRVKGSAAWIDAGTFSFTATALLAEPLGPYDTAAVIEDAQQFPADVIGDSAMLGSERVRIDAYNPATGAMTITRGVADTIPRSHEAGLRLWLPDDDLASNEIVYSPGEEIELAAATRANSSLLSAEDYEVRSVTMQQRVGRPYPVADLRVDGDLALTLDALGRDAPELTWATRNRVIQQDQLVGHGAGSVAEEEGTTYEVVVKTLDGVVLRTEALPAATTSFIYTAEMQAADGSPNVVLMDPRPVRGDLRPLQTYDIRVTLKSGYGYGWGLNYGGA